ncbi:hypothetical protein BT96DRAFT_1002642 [Gymnopus androsaceus JB14]|uniref:Uncharacterized protein n=1 Tax=Gymnopus androsaceus JB14 TaxID=1447944 RepID=A0A6A4GX68_9AGAR|nr:hypothetical protein BT96DRAFT_1002642 [Gymnopus androsaceus JB14]
MNRLFQKLQDDWEAANAPLRAQYEAQLRADKERAELERQREEETQRLREEEQRQQEGETAKGIEKKQATSETNHGLKERNRGTVNTNRFQLATDDESGITFLGPTLPAPPPMPSQMQSYWNYPPKFITMFARFYDEHGHAPRATRGQWEPSDGPLS